MLRLLDRLRDRTLDTRHENGMGLKAYSIGIPCPTATHHTHTHNSCPYQLPACLPLSGMKGKEIFRCRHWPRYFQMHEQPCSWPRSRALSRHCPGSGIPTPNFRFVASRCRVGWVGGWSELLLFLLLVLRLRQVSRTRRTMKMAMTSPPRTRTESQQRSIRGQVKSRSDMASHLAFNIQTINKQASATFFSLFLSFYLKDSSSVGSKVIIPSIRIISVLINHD